ncbi:MAG: Uxx-star family glutaredoxin-like (seleno)protein [Patescibacteria group bacterium]
MLTPADKNKVEIYSTPGCAYCKMAKEYFKQRNVSYTEHDVLKDVAKQQEMIAKTHQYGVPVIIINGKIILGFDRAKIDKLLDL